MEEQDLYEKQHLIRWHGTGIDDFIYIYEIIKQLKNGTMKKLILVIAIAMVSLAAHAQTDTTHKRPSGYNSGDPGSPNAHNDNYQNYGSMSSGSSAAKKNTKQTTVKKGTTSSKAPVKKTTTSPANKNTKARADSTAKKPKD
jgi:hypothetical protein